LVEENMCERERLVEENMCEREREIGGGEYV